MKNINQFLDRLLPVGLVGVRVLLGGLFILHGIDKFNVGLSMVEGMFSSWGVPAASFAAPAVAVVEIVLGAALVFGFFTRVSALALSVVMVGAIIFAKSGNPILGVGNEGMMANAEIDLAYLSGLFALIVTGAGAFSLDAMMKLENFSLEKSRSEPVVA